MATAPTRSDAVLVQRLRERDRSAWDELYDAYGRRLRAFAYRLAGNPHDADDLVQETFVRALPRLDRLDPETTELGPYLFTTLRNLFLKSVSRRAEPMADVPEPDEPSAIEDDPERSTLLHDQQEGVRVANSRLAPRQRLVLALRELEDRSYAEIGVIVGLNENAVAQLISRARESLRLELRLTQLDPSRLPDECRKNLPLISRHRDGQLRGPQLDATLAHLEGCERCQDALDSMREAQRRYRALPPLVWTGDELRKRIDLELTAAGWWAGPRVGRFRKRGALLVAAAALFAAGGAGVGAAILVSDGDPVAVAATTSTAESTSAAVTTAAITSALVRPAPTTTAKQPTPKPKPRPATTSAAATATQATTEAETEAAATEVPAPPPATEAATTTPPPPPAAKKTTVVALDTTAPTVTFLARPPAETVSGAATFSFRASEQGVTFSCRLDGAGFAPCVSPAKRNGLGVGAHAFAVRARDRAGNIGPPASVGWAIVAPPDTTPPIASIVAASTPGGDASFTFTASEAGATFTCSLDGGAFEACATPRAYSGLAPGAHTFSVRATDSAGNTGNPATHAWTIAQPPPPLPDLVVSVLTKSGFTVTNTGSAPAGPFVVSVTLIGTFTFAGLAPGQSATRTWSICRIGTITAIADRGQAVAESDEGNNARSIVSAC